MVIKVTHGPSGQVVEFPDGTDAAHIQRAMRQMDAAPKPSSAPQAERPGYVSDVANSFGSGLAQGVIGIGAIPGEVENLGRKAINWASPGAVSPETELPRFGKIKSTVEEIKGSEFYKPQTLPGEYAKTIGEFAPAALAGPGGMAVRAANVAVPAVASETMGQMTKGTAAEPYARFAGAMLTPSGALRAVTPNPVQADQAAAVAALKNEGVTALTAGQQTGSKPLRWFESATQDIPFAGNKVTTIAEKQAEQFTQAVLKRAGINATRATPDVLEAGATALGQKFSDIASRNSVMIDRTAMQKIGDAVNEYMGMTPEAMRVPALTSLADAIGQSAGKPMAGDLFARLRSLASDRSYTARLTDPEQMRAWRSIRDALDDAAERSIPAKDAAAWREARQQYGALMRIEDAMAGAGENTAKGLVSPAQLRNAVKAADKKKYVRGKDELGNISRAAEVVMKPLPQSGTAPRANAMSAYNALAAALGYGAAGAPGAVAGIAAPALASRAITSKPVQNYLANQVMTAPMNALARGAVDGIPYYALGFSQFYND